MLHKELIKVAIGQISPVWLNKSKTIDKIKSSIADAAGKHCDLITFGEALLPGYPHWTGLSNSTAWNSKTQKEIFAHYLQNAITPESGELDGICKMAKDKQIAIYLGFIERAKNRGGHSLYCALGYINKYGEICSVHRKLQPTYDERLVWSPGDGMGLQVHPLNGFTVGGLNCWENWMPLPRAALYGQGENLHVAVWPGSKHNTEDITKFIAKESRSFVVSASVFMRQDDIPKNTPHLETILERAPDVLTDGGSCIAGPDGNWIVEPVTGKEILITAELEINRVFEERQNFDPSGHYSRPDVTQLTIYRERQSVLRFE
ncbi:MAG: carbon-nitrogen hydrolase family protein [Bacteroidales bacterium]|nr:carbon-nitrogen hydrolase family protein [Bacteroidales bacterium]